MARKVINIVFTFAGSPKTSDVDATLTAVGDDWIRLASNNWMVWTERSASDWLAILKPYTSNESRVFMAALDLSDRDGWQPKWVWDWINSRHGEQQRAAADLINAYFESLHTVQNALSPPPARGALGGFINSPKK
jgi:hypothetical protein